MKSIYSRYLLTFAILLAVGFTAVGLLLGASISDYSIREKQEFMNKTSATAYEVIFGLMDTRSAEYAEVIEGSPWYISKSLENLASISDSTIIFTDASGNIMLQVGEISEPLLKDNIPRSLIDAAQAGNSSYSLSDLGGLFGQKCVNNIRLVHDEGELVGVIFICSPSTTLQSLVGSTALMIVISCAAVFLVAVIVLFFITSKISEPLKELTRAAKEFSSGHFETRVDVRGTHDMVQLADAFNNMAESVEKIEENQRNFIGNVSHDLRTPMTSIQGFVDGILSGAIPPEKQHYYLTVVSNEVKRLARLVSSLLDITKLQAGEKKFVMSPFDICETLRLILISFEEKITEKKLDIAFECEDEKSMAYADRDSIHQVAYNLIDNAIKFTPEGGTIRVSVGKRDKKYAISVYNTGEGIASENLPHVFEKFYKTDRSRGMDKTGVGLGLYIVKAIIDAHDQQISADSVYHEYCEFIFTLAIATQSQIAAAKEKKR